MADCVCCCVVLLLWLDMVAWVVMVCLPLLGGLLGCFRGVLLGLCIG